MSCNNITRIYHPFIGSTTNPSAPTPPPLTPPVITPITQITFDCPAKSISVTVRNPRFGDKDELTYTRINRETRGGLIFMFKSVDWPEIEKLILEFEGLTENKTEELLNFNLVTVGEQVTLTDWESNNWAGIMTAGVVVRNRGSCGNSITIEFEGSRI